MNLILTVTARAGGFILRTSESPSAEVTDGAWTLRKKSHCESFAWLARGDEHGGLVVPQARNFAVCGLPLDPDGFLTFELFCSERGDGRPRFRAIAFFKMGGTIFGGRGWSASRNPGNGAVWTGASPNAAPALVITHISHISAES